MGEFVNPYTFVPHVAEPERGIPAGHGEMGDGRYSGVLKIAVTARTPLLIGGFPGKAEDGREKTLLPTRKAPEGTVFIPGSGLMGAVRSTHEALVGGCMRVLNLDWVPVHRHPANATVTKKLTMAVVTDIDAKGIPTEVALCDRERWVAKELLPGNRARPVRTGDQLRYDGADEKKSQKKSREIPSKFVSVDRERHVVRAYDREKNPAGLRPGQISRLRGMGDLTERCQVVLVTDTKARGRRHPVFFAVGSVGPDSVRCELRRKADKKDRVTLDAWDRYCRTVDKADDLRPEVLKKAGVDGREPPEFSENTEPEYADVLWPPQSNRPQDVIGKRLYARKYFHIGQPVWVEVERDRRQDKDLVTELRLSYLWRYEGGYSVGDRIGEHAKGCTDPENLCWSCRIFGSADTEGRDDDGFAEQNSYRGHVRIDDLLAVKTVEPKNWELAPLASPKPSAGQFYLDNSEARATADPNTAAVSTWGSVGDKSRPRNLRGRKFYWRTDTDLKAASKGQEWHRSKKRKDQSKDMSKPVELIPPTTRFEGRITFDNLSAEDYGSLLAALAPSILARAGDTPEDGWENTVISVGGGKPFGFGSVDIEILESRLQTARGRYLGEAAEGGQAPPTEREAVSAFLAADTLRPARKNWQALRHALAFGFVDDADVWYPVGDGNRGEQGYDKSFEYFGRTNGLRFTSQSTPDRPLKSLPPAAAGKERQKLTTPRGKAGR